MPTGEVSGIDVLDVDVRAHTPVVREEPPHDDRGDGFAALANLPALPTTLSASTPRNGRHFYFRHVVGGRNRKLGDGSVEWFSTGKLVVVPPAPGRAWLNQADIAEAPDWLKALVSAPKPIHTQDRDHEGGSSGPQVNEPDLQSQSRETDRHVPRDIYFLILRGMGKASSKQQRRVRGLWKNLAEKTDHRNDGLNYTAWQFREFVEVGDLKIEVASKLLWLACEANGYLDKDGPGVIDEIINRVLQGD
jgi:Bifunctional DNA primase/polymerase, N-terminal